MTRLFLLAALAPALFAEPVLFFSKSFPGSTPAYVEITVSSDGKAVYKEAPDDELPVRFTLTPEETKEMYGLADKLNHFRIPLESGLKVAFMGAKTFRYLDGDNPPEQKFNYSENPDARALHEWFERISETALHFALVNRAVKYDRLGINKAILQFEGALMNRRIVSPATFLPLLDRVAKNDTYMNMARTRAANLADAIREATAPPSQPAQ